VTKSQRTFAAGETNPPQASASQCLKTGKYTTPTPSPLTLKHPHTYITYSSVTEAFSDTGCTQMDGSHSFLNQPAVTLCWTYKTSVKSSRWLTQKAAAVRRDEAQACNVMKPNVVFRVRDGVTTKIKLETGMSAEEALEIGEGEVVDAITGEYEGFVE
jgi:hypothetical protein